MSSTRFRDAIAAELSADEVRCFYLFGLPQHIETGEDLLSYFDGMDIYDPIPVVLAVLRCLPGFNSLQRVLEEYVRGGTIVLPIAFEDGFRKIALGLLHNTELLDRVAGISNGIDVIILLDVALSSNKIAAELRDDSIATFLEACQIEFWG